MSKRPFYKNKVLYKKIPILSFFLLILVSLGGCSLACDDGDGARTGDQLIGGMVTTSLIEKTYGEAEWDGDRLLRLDFPTIEGIYAVNNKWEEKDGPVNSTVGLEGTDYSTHFKVENENQILELHINAYLSQKEGKKSIFYLNPIYMTADQKIYVAAGDSVTLTDGASMGKSLDYTEKIKLGGKKIEMTTRVYFDCSLKNEVKKVWFSQMDDKNQLIKKESFLPGQVPEIMTVEKDTAYLVVMTEEINPEGKTLNIRESCNWDGVTTYSDEKTDAEKEQKASLLHTFYGDESGFLLKDSTWVIWP